MKMDNIHEGNSDNQQEWKKNRKRKRRKKRNFLKHGLVKSSKVYEISSVQSSPPDGIQKDKLCDSKTFPKPNVYCRFVARFPVFSFLLALSVHIGVLASTIGLFMNGYDIFPADFSGLPLYLTQDETWARSGAFRMREKIPNYLPRNTNDGTRGAFWDRGRIVDSLEVIFKVSSGNIYSVENLEAIYKAEKTLFSVMGYEKYCLTERTGECQRPGSVLRYFDGTYVKGYNLSIPEVFHNTEDILCNAYKNQNTMKDIKLYLEKGYNPCQIGAVSKYTRIFLHFGYNHKEEMIKVPRKDFQLTKMRSAVHHIRDVDLKNRMDVYYISTGLLLDDLTTQSNKDMWWGAGSGTFVVMVMWIQTGSLWITFMGLYSIVTSYLIANLIYRYCFGFVYFGFFHIAAMFIIIGIGADDVFVFYDTWRLTSHKRFPSKAHRLSEFYRKAAKTTFVTSFTTSAAFFVTSFSPLLPVKTFGLFSGLLVSVNYLFDLLYFPTSVMLYSEKIEPFTRKMSSRCFSCCKKQKLDSKENSFNDAMDVSSNNSGTKRTSVTSLETKQKIVTKRERINYVVEFFKDKFYTFIMWKPIKIGIPIVFLLLTIFFAVFASKVEANADYVQIFVSSHNYDTAYRMHLKAFQAILDHEYTNVYLLWGMKEQDLSTCNTKSSKLCYGVTRFESLFDPSTEAAQIKMMDLCERFHNMTDEQADQLRIKTDPFTKHRDVDCFMTDLVAFLKKEETQSINQHNISLSIPVRMEMILPFMEAHPHFYQSDLPSNFSNWLEIVIDYWLSNSYTGISNDDYAKYFDLLGRVWVKNQTKVFDSGNTARYYGSKLGFIVVKIGTTIERQIMEYRTGLAVYNAWEALMNKEVQMMPDSMKSGFQLTTSTWHDFKVQEVLVTYAINGLIIGICLALPILIVTSLNIVIGLLATMVIGLVITCVVGLLPLCGLTLGVTESLNLSLVVGLSVDYVVHFSEAYISSPSPDRAGRVQHMLGAMGLSVASGALTTFGAASFMLASKIHLIFQFGVFVMSIISISFVYTLFAFTTFMALFGPQGDTGSLVFIWRKCTGRIKSSCKVSTEMNFGRDDIKAREEIAY